MRRAPLALVPLAFASLAGAQQKTARAGASLSTYFFADKRISQALGDPAITYGASLSEIKRPQAGKLAFAYDIISAKRSGSTLFLLPVSVGIEKQFGDSQGKAVPYARIEAGAAYYDVAIHNGGYDRSFKTGGAVGAAEIGFVLNQTFSLKAKYYLFQDRFGVNLSGAQFGVVYNFTGF